MATSKDVLHSSCWILFGVAVLLLLASNGTAASRFVARTPDAEIEQPQQTTNKQTLGALLKQLEYMGYSGSSDSSRELAKKKEHCLSRDREYGLNTEDHIFVSETRFLQRELPSKVAVTILFVSVHCKEYTYAESHQYRDPGLLVLFLYGLELDDYKVWYVRGSSMPQVMYTKDPRSSIPYKGSRRRSPIKRESFIIQAIFSVSNDA
jgi:hypothetical protein